MTLCYIDTETTGLDPRIHQPYEVCYWREDEDQPYAIPLPHTLEYADQAALKIGGYWERGFKPREHRKRNGVGGWAEHLIVALRGVTLIGSNPAFDAAMLTRFIGAPVWHHRMVDVSNVAMVVFDWDRPKGLADVMQAVAAVGFDIPEPDHTAEGDVRTTRAVYEALREIRGYAS